MARKPTLKDVANAAGISEMTVSRALRATPDVSEKTRAKVAKIADELGYVPNRIAGALASRSVNLVGVVVPSLSSFVFPEVLAGISETLGSSPLQPVIGVSGYDPLEEEKVIREMLSWRPAGLIIAGLEHSQSVRKLLQAADIPIIEVMDTDGTPIDYCVGISHLAAGQQMAKAILGKGYRNIGFIGTKMPRDFRAQKRLQGFADQLAAAHITLSDQRLYSGVSTVQKGRELTAELLEHSPNIDCIYYSSDVMSMGGLMHCLANGLSVPNDLAMAGFNRLELLDGLPIRLATTDAFRFEIGKKAAQIILDRANKTDPPNPKVVEFSPVIDFGQSL